MPRTEAEGARLPHLFADAGSRAGHHPAPGEKRDRKHDIPSLAGYGQEGKTIYIVVTDGA
jgi:hypothetical protein